MRILACEQSCVRVALTESNVGPPIKGGASRPAELSGDVLVGGLAQDVLRKKGFFYEDETCYRYQWRLSTRS